MSRIVPYLRYHDVARARDFLITAFGFRERKRPAAPEGKHSHSHVELELDDGSWIKMGRPHTGNERAARGEHSWVTIQVEIDDVDAHFARAKAAGATIVDDVQDNPYGDRFYRAVDPEGQLWSFVRLAAHE